MSRESSWSQGPERRQEGSDTSKDVSRPGIESGSQKLAIRPFRMPCTGRPGAEDKMALDGTSERCGSPSAKVQCSFKCRCGRPLRRRRSMDQKTRVAVKYRSNVGHGYYFGVLMCVHRSTTSPSLSFHAFLGLFLALKFMEQAHGAWIHAIRRDVGKDFKVTSNTRVCSAHFRESSDNRVSAYAGTAAAPSCAGKGLWCPTQYLRCLSRIAACTPF